MEFSTLQSFDWIIKKWEMDIIVPAVQPVLHSTESTNIHGAGVVHHDAINWD